jgi:hypothetical protein
MNINDNVGMQKNQDGILLFGVYRTIKDKRVFIPKGEAVILNSIITNIETKEQFYELSFSKDDGMETVLLPCEKLTKAGVLSLAKNGVDVTENNATVLLYCLQNQRFNLVHGENNQKKYVHKQLGWFDYILKDGAIRKIFKGYSLIPQYSSLTSAYVGNYAIEPQGSAEGWFNIIQEHVLDNAPLELAVVLGLSACVNAFVGKLFGCDNILVHILGESTTGKTTASMLALSTAGYPDQNSVSKESLFITF